MTHAIDKYDQRLSLVGSEDRAGVLVDVLRDESDDDVARALLAHWFNMCDALAPHRDGLLEQMRRVGYFSDNDEQVALPATVYRAAWADDDPRRGLSWTTSRATAEFFARYLTGPRAWFLGIRREDVDPVIWQAEAREILGYLNGRNEHEVLPDPDYLEDVQVISVLTTVKEEA